MHILRTNKCFDNPRLDTFDNLVRTGLETVLNVQLTPKQWTQTCLPIREGVLGVRTTVSMATSAFMASAVSTRGLQEQILPSAVNVPDPLMAENLSHWMKITATTDTPTVLYTKQIIWDDAVVRQIKSELVASFITKTQKARFLGAQSDHAGDWLHAMPISNCGLHLDDETTRIAVGLRLGAAICHPHTCPCGGLVDALGHHCFVCRKSIGKQTRHSLFNDVIWHSFARAKIQASKEPLGIFNDNKRPDGVTSVPWQRGKCVAWDVTVVDTFAASYIDSTAISAGAAAERAATLKTNKYQHLQNKYIFVPLACEVMGSWSIVSVEFLDNLSGLMPAVHRGLKKK